MIKRRVEQDDRLTHEQLEWNAFVHILALHEYWELEPVQQIPHLAFWYEHNVQNGGHIQYFENCGTQLLPETLEALKIMGANGHRAVLERAGDAWFGKPREPFETVEDFVGASLEGEFAEFDSAYYDCQPDMVELLARYLKKHREHFIEE